MKLPIILLLLLSIASCSTKKEHSTALTKVESEPVRVVEKIIIDLDSLSLPSYHKMNGVYEGDNQLLYYAFNNRSGLIDCFDLKNRTISHIAIQETEKNNIQDIMHIYPFSPDSLFVFYFRGFCLIDSDGKILEKHLPEVSVGENSGWLYAGVEAKPYYSRATSDLYCSIVYDNWDAHWDLPIAVQYNLQSKEVELLPLYLGNEYKSRYRELGYTNLVQLVFGQEAVVYNYNFSPLVYRFDYLNKASENYYKKESMIPSGFVFSGNGDEEKMRNYITNPLYNPPMMWGDDEALIQLCWSSGKDSVDDKPLVLSKYDLNKHSFTEQEIDNAYILNSEFGVNDGLLLIRYDRNNPDERLSERIEFHIIQ